MGESGKGCHIEIIEEFCRIMVFGKIDMNFGLGDMNRYTPYAV
jgi:hypothetical protein